MQAVQGYRPQAPRTASVGASLVISGAIIAALVYASPNVVRETVKIFKTTNYEDPLPPPPAPQPLPKPEIKDTPVESKIVSPKPIVETRSETAVDTTRDIPIVPPQPVVVEKVGPPVVADPPKPVPLPLVPAATDPRYAGDFQPQYPSSELRAEREGSVSVRVLIGVEGRVKAVEQVRATSPAFFEATRRQALAKWRFRPATRGGVAEESWKVLNVRFKLDEAR